MITSRINHKASRGMSLIELMVVLAIFGILMSIAVSSYGQYFTQAKRQDATALLHENVQRLERCFTLEGVYNGACTLRATSEDGYYSLTTTRAEQSYTLSAVPIAGKSQANDADCATFTMTSTGERGATGAMGALCW